MSLDPVLRIDVGGSIFKVLRENIMRFPNSTIAAVIAGRDPEHLIKIENTYFFDRNPDYFSVVLDFIRTGKWFVPKTIIPEQLIEEAKFWKIEYKSNKDKAKPIQEYEPTLPVTEKTVLEPHIIKKEHIIGSVPEKLPVKRLPQTKPPENIIKKANIEHKVNNSPVKKIDTFVPPVIQNRPEEPSVANYKLSHGLGNAMKNNKLPKKPMKKAVILKAEDIERAMKEMEEF